MKTDISVAIVVPVLNEAQVLPSTLLRFMALEVDELIFVDGGSSDDTQRILSQSGVRWETSAQGRAAQMNAGAKASTADILVFMHADTIIDKGELLALKSAMQSSEFVGGRFDVKLSGTHPAFRMIEFMINLRSRVTKISTGDQVQFVRRRVFESMGGFAAMPLLEDVAFSKQLKKHGRIISLKDRVITSSRRWEKFGVRRTVWLMWKIRLLYWWGVSPDKLVQLYHDAR